MYTVPEPYCILYHLFSVASADEHQFSLDSRSKQFITINVNSINPQFKSFGKVMNWDIQGGSCGNYTQTKLNNALEYTQIQTARHLEGRGQICAAYGIECHLPYIDACFNHENVISDMMTSCMQGLFVVTGIMDYVKPFRSFHSGIHI